MRAPATTKYADLVYKLNKQERKLKSRNKYLERLEHHKNEYEQALKNVEFHESFNMMTSCGVCHKILEDPHLSKNDCSHMFCKKCFEGLLKKRDPKKPFRRPGTGKCPICHKPIDAIKQVPVMASMIKFITSEKRLKLDENYRKAKIHQRTLEAMIKKDEEEVQKLTTSIESFKKTINEAVLNCFPTLTNEKEIDIIANLKCVICQNIMRDPHVVNLSCQHCCCKDCLLQWLSITNSCPLCRSQEICMVPMRPINTLCDTIRPMVEDEDDFNDTVATADTSATTTDIDNIDTRRSLATIDETENNFPDLNIISDDDNDGGSSIEVLNMD